MTKKINNIEQEEITKKSEKRWFSAIKKNIDKIDYGELEISLIVKKGEVTALKVKEKGRTYNIGG
ncbi:MAG: hypothetical protein ACOC1P_06090 [Minisyncoccales bacterium]